MDVEVRPIEPDELEPWLRAVELAFGGHLTPEDVANERKVLEVDRTLAALDGSQIVGCASALSFELTVPGATVPAAGVTGVGVRPTHRRQGINTALMRRQLDDVREREPLAVLFASEGGIYGRFGYGLGSFMASVDVGTDRAAFVRGYEPRGRTRLLDRGEALEAFASEVDRARRGRPGSFAAGVTWLDYTFAEKHFGEDRHWFFAVHEGQDGVDGIAAYLVKHDWQDSVPKSRLELAALDASNPYAYADLWRLVLDTDLVHRVTAWNRPADEPLVHLLREPRRASMRLRDGLWVRLVDVRRALGARRYAASDRLVFEVQDAFCSWNDGRVELEAGPDGAESRSTDTAPDLVVSVNELGAAYLGGVSFRELYRAGRVSERREGALARADAMFAWDPAPWCPFVF